jgi:hypothetical protein
MLGDAVPKTGSICEEPGIYEGSDEDEEQISLKRGETFPPCDDCQKPMEWTLIQPAE